MLSESPRFNAATRYSVVLLALGMLFTVLGGVLLTLALESGAVWRAPGYLGAALWTVTAAFLPTAILSFARQRLLGRATAFIGPRLPSEPTDKPAASLTGRLTAALRASLEKWVLDDDAVTRWPPVLVAMLFGVLALVAIRDLWRLPAAPPLDALPLQIGAAALVLAAFPLLLLERSYAGISTDRLPEAPQIDRLLRVPLTACMALALAQALMSVGFGWAVLLERATGILIALVALELILRNAVAMFLPFAPLEQRQSLTDSSLSGALLRLSAPSLRSINMAVRRRLGIDLSRSWALAYIQKAALPALVGVGLFGWAVTGISTLGLNERGIYERFGVPVAVLGPGLHLHLPWPLGVIRPVEFGAVHLLPIEFVLPGGEETGKSSLVGDSASERPVGAEDSAPESADRLWTDDHPFEGNYIIASAEGGKQSFQLVDIDMAVLYRVGLSDQAARDAAYRVSNADEMIQALSGQLLVRYFTHNTLLDLLGKSRESFTRQFQAALQSQLNRFSSGIEVSGVSVEAIHPPPGAASAYHDVQAAEIRANTEIAQRRGDATRSLMTAQQAVIEDHNGAVAAAAERTGQARSQATIFGGESQAFAHAGYPFLLERWLESLTQGLGQSQLVLIDHRLAGPGMPALDVRELNNPAASDVSSGIPPRSEATPPASQPPTDERTLP